MTVGGTVEKCLWGVTEQGQAAGQEDCESTLRAPRLPLLLHSPFQSQSSSVVLETSWPCLNPIRNSV